jgi:hypothetical protein
MGRVGSVYGLIEAFLVIITTVIFGITAQLISIPFIVIVGSLSMLLITLILCILNIQPSKIKYYEAESADPIIGDDQLPLI